MDLITMYRDMFASDLCWDKTATAQRLHDLRINNENLKKYCCKHSRLYKEFNEPHRAAPCPNDYLCEQCTDFYDKISQGTVARCFSREKREIYDLERGINVTFEKVLLYAYLAQLPLAEVLVLNEGYCFENGIIKKIGKEM